MPDITGEGRRHAFTLIELLVVIGIIGVLAALILTAVSKAKNSASKATDINNLRQIMLALHNYTAEDGDIIPPPNWDGGKINTPNGTNPGWLYALSQDATSPADFKVQTGLFWSSLRNPAVYFCPMDNPQMIVDGEPRPQQISSYAMNGAVIGYASEIYPPVKLTLMHPTDCAFWETDETHPEYFNDGANYPGEGVSGRHYQGGIQAAFDTSVSYIRMTDWYNDVADSNKNRLWCYPLSADGGDPNAPGHQQE